MFSFSPTELFDSFINLVQTNYIASFAVSFLGVIFLLYVIYNQTRNAIADALNRKTRKVFIMASMVILFIGIFIAGGVVEGIRRVFLPAPIISAPRVVIGQTGILEWKLPAKMKKKDVGPFTFLIQSWHDKNFTRPYKSYRTNDHSFPLFSWENLTLYWRVRALLPSVGEETGAESWIWSKVRAVMPAYGSEGRGNVSAGTWSNEVKVQQYDDIFQRIVKTGELRVAISRTHGQGYFSFYHGNNRRGVDPALACHIRKTLAQSLGQPVHIRFLYRTWNDLLMSVRKGEADVALSSITILPEREKKYNARFSAPYHKTGFALAYRKGKKVSSTARAAVLNYRVGVRENSSSKKCIEILGRQTGGRLKFETYRDPNTAYRDIMNPNGKIDLYMTDTPFATGWRLKNKDRVGVTKFSKEDFDLGTDQSCWEQKYGVLVKSGEDRLLDYVNKTVKTLVDDGGLIKIKSHSRQQYWQAFNLSSEELKEKQDARTYKGTYCDSLLDEIREDSKVRDNDEIQ